MSYMVITTAIYTIEHVMIGDIENIIVSGFQFCTTFSNLVTISNIVWKKKTMRRIFDKVQDVINLCK